MRITRLGWIPALAAALTIGACTAEQTQEGELPDVDVEGGQAPAYDVETADVEVTTDTSTVVTPDVDVSPPSN